MGGIAAGSIVSIQRYWSVPKSPEGLAVLFVKGQSHPEDAILSLHYSLDVALSFYNPAENVYIKPRQSEDRVIFSDITLETTAPGDLPSTPPRFDLEDIRARPRLWLLTRASSDASLVGRISAGCEQAGAWQFPPFQVILLENCTD